VIEMTNKDDFERGGRVAIKILDPSEYNEKMRKLYPGSEEKMEAVGRETIERIKKAIEDGATKTCEVVKGFREVRPGEWGVFLIWSCMMATRFTETFLQQAILETGKMCQEIEGDQEESNGE